MNDDVCVDLYAGLGGWAEGFLAENFTVIGFDIERHDYGTGGYPGQLVLQDVLTIHGAQFKPILDRLRVIVASPPCQKYSYMAMPWKRAKALAAWYREDASRQVELNALFNACFRIQREASEAAGRHIPLIVENVKGAEPWAGKSQANFGSFYLWGDVGRAGNRVIALNGRIGSDVGVRPRSSHKVPGFRFDGSGGSFQTASVKVTGQNWSRYSKTGEVSPDWRMEGLKVASGSGRSPAPGNGVRFTSRDCGLEGIKQRGSGREWFAGEGKISRVTSSNSEARARASAEIAKIPFPLAQHLAKCFASSFVPQ